jgi:hypothetical protein
LENRTELNKKISVSTLEENVQESERQEETFHAENRAPVKKQSVPRSDSAVAKTRGRAEQDTELISRREAIELTKVGRILVAAANPVRIKMLAYCSQPRKFSEIVKFYRMNPASFQFHEHLLRSEGLLERSTKSGLIRYQTTSTGKVVLKIIRGPFREALAE